MNSSHALLIFLSVMWDGEHCGVMTLDDHCKVSSNLSFQDSEIGFLGNKQARGLGAFPRFSRASGVEKANLHHSRASPLVSSALCKPQKKRMEGPGSLGLEEPGSRRIQNFAFSGGLYGGLPPTHSEAGSQPHGIHGTALIGGLPMPYPNLAPDVDLTPVVPSAVNMNPAPNPAVYNPEAVNEPKKKKYAKEAWPGKKPTPSLLIWYFWSWKREGLGGTWVDGWWGS